VEKGLPITRFDKRAEAWRGRVKIGWGLVIKLASVALLKIAAGVKSRLSLEFSLSIGMMKEMEVYVVGRRCNSHLL